MLSHRAKARSRALHAASVVHSTSSLILIFALSVGAKGLVCQVHLFQFNHVWVLRAVKFSDCSLELSLNLIWFDHLWGVGPLWNSVGCFELNINVLFPFVVHSHRYNLNLNEEQPILVRWGPNSFEHHLACQNELDPEWTTIECSLPKLHTTSKHAPTTYQAWKVLYAKQPTPDKKPLQFKG